MQLLTGQPTNAADGKHFLAVHRLIDFVMSNTVSNGAIVLLMLPPADRMAEVEPDWNGTYQPTLHELQAGTLVRSVTVEQTVRNGLAVRFGTFRGAVELSHLGAARLSVARFFRAPPILPRTYSRS